MLCTPKYEYSDYYINQNTPQDLNTDKSIPGKLLSDKINIQVNPCIKCISKIFLYLQALVVCETTITAVVAWP